MWVLVAVCRLDSVNSQHLQLTSSVHLSVTFHSCFDRQMSRLSWPLVCRAATFLENLEMSGILTCWGKILSWKTFRCLLQLWGYVSVQYAALALCCHFQSIFCLLSYFWTFYNEISSVLVALTRNVHEMSKTMCLRVLRWVREMSGNFTYAYSVVTLYVKQVNTHLYEYICRPVLTALIILCIMCGVKGGDLSCYLNKI